VGLKEAKGDRGPSASRGLVASIPSEPKVKPKGKHQNVDPQVNVNTKIKGAYAVTVGDARERYRVRCGPLSGIAGGDVTGVCERSEDTAGTSDSEASFCQEGHFGRAEAPAGGRA